jgi:hypothetical protein
MYYLRVIYKDLKNSNDLPVNVKVKMTLNKQTLKKERRKKNQFKFKLNTCLNKEAGALPTKCGNEQMFTQIYVKINSNQRPRLNIDPDSRSPVLLMQAEGRTIRKSALGCSVLWASFLEMGMFFVHV